MTRVRSITIDGYAETITIYVKQFNITVVLYRDAEFTFFYIVDGEVENVPETPESLEAAYSGKILARLTL